MAASSNNLITPTIIAKEALVILENELGVLQDLHRAPEEEFNNTVNGYKIGATVTIRRPADFTVRSGATLSVQDIYRERQLGRIAAVMQQQRRHVRPARALQRAEVREAPDAVQRLEQEAVVLDGQSRLA